MERDMERSSPFAPAMLERWRRRENLLPGAFLVAVAVAAWVYTIHQASMMTDMEVGMGAMGAMSMTGIGGLALFLSGWIVMMLAMMLPATMPLILLYRTIASQRSGPFKTKAGLVILLIGYIAVWTAAGLPVYAYNLAGGGFRTFASLLPGVLLIAGGLYQFTPLKRNCHERCSSPLFFLLGNWKSGASGALRLGMLHGVDCLGCCAGLMVGLVALGMMNLAWMLTAAVIIFAEKTIPNSHRIARPLGGVMVAGGAVLLAMAWLGGLVPVGMESM
jgi:predicted metal-binding membrane protein